MSEKILLVDDEPMVLEGIRRQLRRRYSLLTAVGGVEGLSLIAREGPIAVVVSDMKMPGMTGAEFLMRVRESSPDTVRMILSGQADLLTTIEAVNEGRIFRFLTKPCQTESLVAAIEAGLEQHRLVIAERELLQDTLSGVVGLLTEVLALVNPEAFSRGTRIQRYAGTIARHIGKGDSWEIRLASMLSQLGCLTVPEDILDRALAGLTLSDAERGLFERHPEVARQLLERIPRMASVAAMVARQMERPTATELAGGLPNWDPEELGGQILRAASEFDRVMAAGSSRDEALAALGRDASIARPFVDALEKEQGEETATRVRLLAVGDLSPGMLLEQDIVSTSGILLVSKGHEVTDTMLARLRNYASRGGVREPIRVRTRGVAPAGAA